MNSKLIAGIFEEVLKEIAEGESKHGVQDYLPWSGDRLKKEGAALEKQSRALIGCWGHCWAAILCEEVAEALRAESSAELRAEMMQVAAVAVRVIALSDTITLDSLFKLPGDGDGIPF